MASYDPLMLLALAVLAIPIAAKCDCEQCQRLKEAQSLAKSLLAEIWN